MYSELKKSSKKIKSFWKDRININNVNYYVSYLLVVLVFTFLIVGLYRLQIVEGRNNLLAATRTSQSTQLILPPRGLIYDASGAVLAYNSPSYSIYIDKTRLKTENEREVINRVASLLQRDQSELINIYRDQAYSETNKEKRIKLLSGISSADYFKLIEVTDELEGVEIVNESQRRYIDADEFAHLVGYVGKPSENDLGDGVYTISIIGKDGIEKVYDEYLRGEVGVEVVQRQILSNIEEENIVENAFTQEESIYGDNVFLNIDSKWQKSLYSIMQERLEETDAFASAGVIMNSDTGEIKAMVSLPSFDNNLFVDAIKTDQYKKLSSDVRTPLLNRVTGLQLPSGSIFKIIGAAAILEENVVTKDTILRSEGCMELSSEIKFCEADGKVLGDVNLVSAIGRSSNLYFCKAAMSLNRNAEGIYSTLKFAKQFGLGGITGIDLLGEQKGTLPSPELKQKLFNENWYVGDDCNSMIGQGLLTVTPVQMLVAVSAVNNGGKVLQPQLLDRVENQSGNLVFGSEPIVVRNLEVDEETLNTIKEGMKAATRQGGTAWQLDGMPGNIIAKTGSADASEIIDGKLYSGAHSWVTGCFEDEGENYCFVFMQQWGGRGFQTVPTAKKMMNCIQKNFEAKCSEIE